MLARPSGPGRKGDWRLAARLEFTSTGARRGRQLSRDSSITAFRSRIGVPSIASSAETRRSVSDSIAVMGHAVEADGVGTVGRACAEYAGQRGVRVSTMIEVIRGDAAVHAHSPGVEYGPWIREQADSIERAFHTMSHRADS
jgi:hypothetical protein